MKPEGQAQWYILRQSMVFNPLGDDSPVRMWAIILLLVEWELGVFRANSKVAKKLCSQRVKNTNNLITFKRAIKMLILSYDS